MATRRFEFDEYGYSLEVLLRLLRATFPTLEEISVYRSPMRAAVLVDVRERDYGVWEWNEEVVP